MAILLEEKKDVVVNGDFQQSQFKLKADPKAFNILSDKIYSHKVRAVIRELSTNAYDAHVAAGQDSPFDVHLPTSLEPWFSVKDYGTGLSHEDCMEIYTTYFMSTKTSSNDFVGALGLGSKSPFCISDSFTVISIYNGVERTYSAYKDEYDQPQFALLTEQETEESNGVEVKVPVSEKRLYEFAPEAIKIYQYFDNVNLNDDHVKEEIDEIKSNRIIENENFIYNGGYSHSKALMGNVCYDVSVDALAVRYGDPIDTLLRNGMTLKFNIGDLAFNAGRESLSFDTRTKAKIMEKAQQCLEILKDVMQEKINKEKTFYAAMLMKDEFSQLGSQFMNGLTWHGKKLVAPELKEPMKVYSYYTRSGYEQFKGIYNKKAEYYYNQKGYVSRIRQKVKDSDHNLQICLIEPSQVDEIGIDPWKVGNLSDLPKVDRQTVTKQSCKLFLIKEFSNYEPWVKEAEVDLNDGEERVYVKSIRKSVVDKNNHEYSLRDIKSQLATLGISMPEVYAVKGTLINQKKFQNSEFIELTDWIVQKLENLPSDKKKVMIMPAGVEKLRYLAKVMPERFKEIVSIMDSCVDCSLTFSKYGVEYKKDNFVVDFTQEIMDKYPMIKIVSGWDIKHSPEEIINYFNLIDGEADVQ